MTQKYLLQEAFVVVLMRDHSGMNHCGSSDFGINQVSLTELGRSRRRADFWELWRVNHEFGS